MNYRIKRKSRLSTRTQAFLRWTGSFLSLAGILALGYAGYVLAYEHLYQAYLTRRFEQELKVARPPTRSGENATLPPLPSSQGDADRARAESFGIDGRAGSPLGRIEISSIGLAAMITEGTDGKTLRRAVGHIPGTAFPGQQGNVALAGHRDTFFRGLQNIHKDDEITLTTLHGSYRYLVDSTQVVEPQDTAVLDNTVDPTLTLVTCFPFYFVGPAPKRFIVRAHKIPE
jgi:sortase A